MPVNLTPFRQCAEDHPVGRGPNVRQVLHDKYDCNTRSKGEANQAYLFRHVRSVPDQPFGGAKVLSSNLVAFAESNCTTMMLPPSLKVSLWGTLAPPTER